MLADEVKAVVTTIKAKAQADHAQLVLQQTLANTKWREQELQAKIPETADLIFNKIVVSIREEAGKCHTDLRNQTISPEMLLKSNTLECSFWDSVGDTVADRLRQEGFRVECSKHEVYHLDGSPLMINYWKVALSVYWG